MLLCAKTSGCAFASSTVSGSSGQPGLTAANPASSKTVTQRSQLDGSSQSPWTNTTGVRPDAFARSTCAASCSLIVLVSGSVLVMTVPPCAPVHWATCRLRPRPVVCAVYDVVAAARVREITSGGRGLGGGLRAVILVG